MEITQNTLGQRLKEARDVRGITQQQAAEILGLPRTAIAHIESGNRSISTVELVDLAKLYGRSVGSFFEPVGSDEHDDALVALHRITTDEKVPADFADEVRKCVEVCREGVSLATMLGRRALTLPPEYDVSIPANFAEAVEQGQAVAEQERQRVGAPHSPIPDMAEFLASQGIWACGAKLPDEMSGLFLHHRTIGIAILVNFDHVRGRKRFSYAHEYGHALMDRALSATITTKKNSIDLVEKRANAFAASFLMPRQAVETLLASLNKGNPGRVHYTVYDVATEGSIEAERRVRADDQQISEIDIALLAVHFGVTYQTAAYRLSDLDYVTRQQLRELLGKQASAETFLRVLDKWDEIAGRGKNDKELVGQVVPLAIEALRRSEISRGKFLELTKRLGVSGQTLLRVE